MTESYTNVTDHGNSRKGASKELNIYTMLELDNIVEELSNDKRLELAQKVIQGYEEDKNSRSTRESQMQKSMELAMQVVKPKTDPWEGCANVIVPLITIASIHFASRAYPAIINDGVVAKSKIIGNDDGIEVPILDPNTGQPPLDEMGNAVIDPETGKAPVQVVGEGIKKERGERVSDFFNYQLVDQSENWDIDTDRLLHILPVTGNVYRKWHWGEDKPESGLILPKNFIVDYFTSDLDKARKTQTFVLYPWEIKERIRSGQYIDFEIGEYNSVSSNVDEIVVDTKKEGNEFTDEGNSPHPMIEQHVRFDLDNDGYEEPYIATVHLPSETLVKLRANYEYDGITEKDGKIIKIKPEIYFVKYGFIPSPDGSFYDLGFGDLLYNINESVNSIINRLLDAGTLASTSSGFVGRGLKIKGGSLKVKSGEFPVIDTIRGSIRDNFVQFQHPEPSQVLFQLLGTLIEMAKEITFSNQIMEGEGGNIPVGTVLQMVEQGLTGFKAVHKRIRRSLGKELKILHRLNSLYLDPRFYSQVTDLNVNADEDFSGKGFDIVPVADLSALTQQQKIAQSQVLGQYLEDPRADGVKILEFIFDSIGVDKDFVKGEPPVQQDPMIELARLEAENTQLQTQNKAKELEMKAQKDQLDLQLNMQKADHQALINEIESDTKARETEMQMAMKVQEAEISRIKSMHEIELKRITLENQTGLSQAQQEKIRAEIAKIEKDLEIAAYKAETERIQAHNISNEKHAKQDKEASDAVNRQNDNKLLADAVKSLKSERKISITKDSEGNISGEIS